MNHSAGLFIGVILVIFTSCTAVKGTIVPTKERQMETQQNFLVHTGLQLPFNDLRVAVGAVNKGEYTDNQGVSQYGATAWLWLHTESNPSGIKKVRVYVGQKIIFDDYSLEILNIGKNEKGTFVELAIALQKEGTD